MLQTILHKENNKNFGFKRPKRQCQILDLEKLETCAHTIKVTPNQLTRTNLCFVFFVAIFDKYQGYI